jgi:hypothetical protein
MHCEEDGSFGLFSDFTFVVGLTNCHPSALSNSYPAWRCASKMEASLWQQCRYGSPRGPGTLRRSRSGEACVARNRLRTPRRGSSQRRRAHEQSESHCPRVEGGWRTRKEELCTCMNPGSYPIDLQASQRHERQSSVPPLGLPGSWKKRRPVEKRGLADWIKDVKQDMEASESDSRCRQR